jgi:Putative zinc-finger
VTPTMDCPEARVSLGVYVLGAIDPAERALVEAHLATCRDCRDELAGLAALPALLARVGTEEAVALAAGDGPPPAGRADGEAPPELVSTVIDLTAARRRRRRWRDASLGVAAALIVAAGVFGGLRLGGSPAPAPAASANYPGQPNGPWQTATTTASGMSATVQYRSMGWGTDLAVKVNGIPVGTSCQLWVIGPGGRRTLAGGWVTDDHEGTVWYPGSAGLATGGVRGFQVTVGGARTLSLSV